MPPAIFSPCMPSTLSGCRAILFRDPPTRTLAPTPRPTATAAVSADLIPDRSGSELRIPLPSPLADVERQVILAHLRQYATKREAARSLGIGLRTLYTKLRGYGLEHF